jgi:hypothetical protein
MANLRQRNPNQGDGDGKIEPLPSGNNVVKPKPSTLLSYRAYIFLASIALSCTVFLLYNKQQPPLPESYVLCSRTGDHIYTVDETKLRVQCLAVHKSHIVAMGSLGEHFIRPQ